MPRADRLRVVNPAARRVQRIYLVLLLGNTLAASFIWGINTLFLLDAGLTNFEAFAANAFFTAGMVLFEIPTGVVADTVGRKASYLLGTITLSVTTGLYWLLWLWHAPFGWWAAVSLLLGLGFTFFSGAVEAWLVDALASTHYTGSLETVFGRGLVVTGVAMFAGSVAGGAVAQATDLGVPFLLRAGVLVVMLVFAFVVMKDLGFTPDHSRGPLKATRHVLRESIEHGLKKRSVRFVSCRRPSPPESASTPSTPCSPTSSSSTATRRRISSRVSLPLCSPCHRSRAGCSPRGCDACSRGARPR
jgi:MFS family permease